MRTQKFLSHASHGIITLLACAFTLFVARVSHAAPDPKIEWQVLETENFSIVYDSRHYALAMEYARDSERAHRATKPFFKEAPRKTVVVLDDSGDLANGFAMGVPYSFITVFPVLPSALDSISDYGDWSLELMTHEYTHILQFEPANGLAKPLRWVFGNILRPNMLLPRWYLEGLAVHLETRLSNHGRLRSEAAMAIPRAMAEENKLRIEDISRLNEVSIPDGVGGLRPYLLGGLLWHELVKQGSEEAIGGLNHEYSRRIPYLINGPVKSRLGVDYAGLLAKTYAFVETRAAEQIDRVKRAGVLESTQLAQQEGFFNHSPVISPNGQFLVYVARTHNQDDRIELIERPSDANASFSNGKRRALTTGLVVSRVSWLPDSSGFVFDKVDSFKRYYNYSDLYHYDLKTKKSKRITNGLRAREAAVSPNGGTLVFAQMTPGSTRLARVDLDGQNYRVLYEPSAPAIRISRPEFLSSTEVIFVERVDGEDVFKTLSLPEGEVRPALTRYKGVGFPRWTSEGLLFSSSASGIENLFLADRRLTRVRPVTNVTTRAMTGEIDPQSRELYYSRLHADGPRIHVATKEAWMESPVVPPRVGPLVDTDWPIHQDEPVSIEPEIKEYSAWPYMLPRYWMPFIYVIPGGSYFSATTSATDPLGKHIYSLQASYDTLAEAPSFAGQYTNQQTRVAYTVAAADIREYLYSADLVRNNLSALVLGSFFLSDSTTKWRAGTGWNYLQTETPARTGPRLETRTGPRAFVEYADVSQKGYEISPERGGTAHLAHTSYLPGLGNTAYDQTEFYGSYYFSKGLPKRHTTAFFLNATYAPRLQNVLLGQSTSAADYGTLLLANDFVMRGYANGSFLGRTMINANAEYRFPVWNAYRGLGTWPVFQIGRAHV